LKSKKRVQLQTKSIQKTGTELLKRLTHQSLQVSFTKMMKWLMKSILRMPLTLATFNKMNTLTMMSSLIKTAS